MDKSWKDHFMRIKSKGSVYFIVKMVVKSKEYGTRMCLKGHSDSIEVISDITFV